MKHLHLLKNLFRYLKCIKFHGLHYANNESEPSLNIYAEDNFSNSATTRSRKGFVYVACGAPIGWSSKQQTTLELSTLELKYSVASHALHGILRIDRLYTIPQTSKMANVITFHLDN